MARLNLIGAVGVRVRPDTSGFRRETKSKILSELAGVDGEVPITPKVNANEAAIRSRVKQIAKNAGEKVELEAVLDDKLAKDSFDRTKRSLERNNKVKIEVESNLKDLANDVRSAKQDVEELVGEYDNLNRASLSRVKRAQDDLTASQEAHARALEDVEKATDDLTKAQRALDQAQNEGTGTDKLVKDLQKKKRAFNEAEKAVDKFQGKMDDYYDDVIDAHLDLEAEEIKYERLIDNANNTLNQRSETLEKQKRLAQERLNLEQQAHTIQVGSLKEVKQMLEENRVAGENYHDTLLRIARTTETLENSDLSHLEELAKRGFNRDGVARIRAEAETAMAEAQLQFLERDRVVRISARIDRALTGFIGSMARGGTLDKDIMYITNKYTRLFTGATKAIAGVSTMGRFTDEMVVAARNMDVLANNAAKLTLILGPLAGTLVSATGFASSLGTSIISLAKGAAILPALGVGLGAMFIGLKDGFGLIKEGITSSGDIVRNVAPELADHMRDISNAFQGAAEAGNADFFRQLTPEFEKLVDSVEPIAGLYTRAMGAAGKFYAGAASGVNEWYASGDMAKSLTDVAGAMQIAAGAAKPLTQSLLDFVTVGSKYLPGLAEDFTNLSQRFADFTRESKENGSIDRWIQEAGRQMTYLGGSIKGAVGMLSALGKAADAAGFGGLRSLSTGLQAASDKMNSPLWQGGMTKIFSGARQGAINASEGFGKLGDAFMLTSDKFAFFSERLGSAVGAITGHVAKMMTNSSLLEGSAKFVDDVAIAAERSGPLVRYMGEAFGQAAEVGGELVKASQQIAEAFFRVWGGAKGLTEGLVAVIPELAELAVAGLDVLHVFTSMGSSLMGDILKGFAALPDPIQRAVVSMTAFTIIASKIRGMGGIGAVIAAQFPFIASAAERARGSIRNFGAAWSLARGEMNRTGGVYKTAAGEIKTLGSNTAMVSANVSRMTGGLKGMAGVITPIGGAARSAGGGLKTFGANAAQAAKGLGGAAGYGLMGAAKGLVGFLGGPLGVALIGAGLAIGAYASQVAAAEKRTQAIKQSMDEFGNATAQTASAVRDNLSQINDTWNGAAAGYISGMNEQRGALGKISQMFNGAKGAVKGLSGEYGDLEKTAAGTGKSMSEVGEIVAQGGPQWDSYREKLVKAYMEAAKNGEVSKELSQELFGTGEMAGKTSGEMLAYIEVLRDQRGEVEAAKASQRELADALGTSSFESKAITDSMAVMNDEMASSSDKASAFKTAMDVMTGGIRSQREAFVGQQAALGQLEGSYGKVREAIAQGVPVFEDFELASGNTITQLNSTSDATRELEGNLRSSYDATLEYAMTVYDSVLRSGGSMGEASNAAMRVMNEWSDTARDGLTNVSGDAEKAGAVIESITGKPYMAEITFMGKTEEFMRAQQLVEAQGRRFDGEAFTAFLKANPDAAMADIENLIDKGVFWSSSAYSAELSADKGEAQAQIDEIVNRGREWNDSEFQAMLDGDNSGFLDAVITAASDGENFTDAEYMGKLTGDSGAFDMMVEEAMAHGEQFGSTEWVARMDIENPGFAEKLFAARHGLEGIAYKDWPVEVRDNFEEVKKAQEDLSSGLGNLDGTTAEVSVKTNAAAQGIILEAFRHKAEGMSNEEIQMRLGLDSSEFDTIMDGVPGKWQTNKAAIEAAEAHLKANPGDIDGAIAAAKEKGLSWGSEEYEASLTAESSGVDTGIADADGKARNWAGTPYRKGIDSDNTAFDNGMDSAQSTLSQFNQANGTAKLDADDEATPKTEQAKTSVSGMDVVSGTGSLYAADKASPVVGIASGLISLFGGLTGSANLDATDNASGKTRGASSLVEFFGGLFGLASIDANDMASPKVQDAKGQAQTFDGQSYNAQLGADMGNVTIQTNMATLAAQTFGQGSYIATLAASIGNVFGVVGSAIGVVRNFASTRASATLSATAAAVGSIVAGARGIVSGFGGMRAVATLAANNGPVSSAIAVARGLGNAFGASRFTSTLGGNSGPFNGVISAARGLGGNFASQLFTATLGGNGGPFNNVVSAARGVGGSFASQLFTSTLGGNSGPFQGVVSSATGQGQSFAARVFSATFTATAGGVQNALNAALSAGRSWAGRVFTAVFNAKKSNANGGYYPGGYFAKGGLINSQLMKSLSRVQRFASGGVRRPENHRAMIANPSTVHRVWAEPETGGEAYIPLASSKRGRSTDILGQVAGHFGLTINKYADGGGAPEYVGGVPMSYSGGSIDYDRLANAVASGLEGAKMNIGRNGDITISQMSESGKRRRYDY